MPATHPTVVLLVSPRGIDCRLLLDGVDVSHFVRAVEVRASASGDEPTEVVVTLLANVEINGEVGRVLVNFPKETNDGETT